MLDNVEKELEKKELDNKDSEKVSGGEKKKKIVCFVKGCGFVCSTAAEMLRHERAVHPGVLPPSLR